MPEISMMPMMGSLLDPALVLVIFLKPKLIMVST
jgi:hypothetical protein